MMDRSPNGDARADSVFLHFVLQSEAGTAPDIEEACRRHPELAAELRNLHAQWQQLGPMLDAYGKTAAGRAHDAPPLPQWASSAEILTRLHKRRPEESRYELGEEIGHGGMGCVTQAWDEDLRRELAMKTLLVREGAGADARAIGRFLEEAQVTAQLDHPGVVPVHELGLDENGRVFFTMQRVRGRDFRKLLPSVWEERDGWNRTRALGVLLKVCETLAYAHAKGVIHRDLKPANIMVGSFGEVYVMDWGLAKPLGQRGAALQDDAQPVETDRRLLGAADPDSGELTEQNTTAGTPPFMSPEQAAGRIDEMDSRSDVYAVGAILYVLLTRYTPYSAPERSPGPFEILAAIAQGPPSPVTRLADDVPPELVAICEKAMARTPQARYQTTQEMADDLRNYLENRVVKAYRTGPLVELVKWVQRNRAVAASLLALIFVGIGGLSTTAYAKAQGEQKAKFQLTRVLRMSDDKVLNDLMTEEPDLWPPLPEMEDRLQVWLQKARAVHGRLEEHRESLEQVETGIAKESLEDLGFDPASEQYLASEDWQQAVLAGLLQEVENLPPLIANVEERLEFAQTVRERTVDGKEAKRLWKECIESLKGIDAYKGVELSPQLGLLPLRRDPGSGLWEFIHVQSGEAPKYEGEGKYELAPETGIVLVLLPGGDTFIGSHRLDRDKPNRRKGDDYVDHLASRDDKDEDLQEVRLDPFFMSKYEMTQAQWTRLFLANPSTHNGDMMLDTGVPLGGPLHPVESVSWIECTEAARRLSLELPTEAQYEYAARAGTTSVYSCGWEVTDLQDHANIADQSLARVTNHEQYERSIDDGWPVHAPIGTFKPNALGLHDMHGNVWSWCRDSYSLDHLRDGDGLRTPAPDVHEKTIRGGSWSGHAGNCRSANRYAYGAENKDDDTGLRPIMTVQREAQR